MAINEGQGRFQGIPNGSYIFPLPPIVNQKATLIGIKKSLIMTEDNKSESKWDRQTEQNENPEHK
ncbi:MAG: hypothetical protein R6U40_12075, partial [Desulfobacterales bacterium]